MHGGLRCASLKVPLASARRTWRSRDLVVFANLSSLWFPSFPGSALHLSDLYGFVPDLRNTSSRQRREVRHDTFIHLSIHLPNLAHTQPPQHPTMAEVRAEPSHSRAAGTLDGFRGINVYYLYAHASHLLQLRPFHCPGTPSSPTSTLAISSPTHIPFSPGTFLSTSLPLSDPTLRHAFLHCTVCLALHLPRTLYSMPRPHLH